jgi:hypothetical protein
VGGVKGEYELLEEVSGEAAGARGVFTREDLIGAEAEGERGGLPGAVGFLPGKAAGDAGTVA